ncbi:MAG: molybdopterin-dependent oxidoreductase [Verrucomicrobia bacterium]|nr:molybdopterin-dependent oxidoreductase [Verrucomicrobiota bacterium]
MSEPAPLLNVQIDGVWHQFPKGTRVIEACARAGKFVPRYCYHPKLSSPGNCRMCLIEMGMPKMGPDRKPELGSDGKPVINWIPRPQISCAQDIAEGMGVKTDSPLVQECRHGVMEFLLINHPLDCPICDQAGECELQEFSVQYGNGGSRFREEKVKKPKHVVLGPRVTLDDERCILCSRCIRFMKEIAKDDVLGFASRGSHTYLTAHPGRVLDSNYSLNTVDICPVGALTSTDFRFKMRVWFLKETKSICTSCATGCNTIVGSRQNVIYRQTPRENDDVNSAWMCDYGRLNFHFVNSKDRLNEPQIRSGSTLENVNWNTAFGRAVEELKRYQPDEIAVIGSGRMTNEELWLTKKLIDGLKVTHYDIVPRTGEADDLLLNTDRNPNTNGAKLLGVSSDEPGVKLRRIIDGVSSGQIKAVIALHEDLTQAGLSAPSLEQLGALIVVGILPNETTKRATILLPGVSFAEKRGTMINAKGRLQRLNRAIQSPGNAHEDWEILRDLVQQLTGENGVYLIEDVFKQMAENVPQFEGLSISKVGDLGVRLLGVAEAAPA